MNNKTLTLIFISLSFDSIRKRIGPIGMHIKYTMLDAAQKGVKAMRANMVEPIALTAKAIASNRRSFAVLSGWFSIASNK